MEVEEGKPKNEMTLSTGVVLRLKQVNPMILEHMLRHSLPELPRPPKVWIEAKGREEENPDHPDYLAALDEYQGQRSDVTNAVLMGLGTELLSVPDGMDRASDTGWAEQLEAVGMADIPTNGLKRYIHWLRFWACRSAGDTVAVLSAVTNQIATPEGKVAEAADSFRNRAERRADSKRTDKPRR